MKRTSVERYMVAVLFILVIITFSLAQRDTKKLEKLYTGNGAITSNKLTAAPPKQNTVIVADVNQ